MSLLHESGALVLPLVFVAAGAAIVCIRSGRPVLVVLARWILWIGVSLGFAMAAQLAGVTERPLWATTLFCLLLWQLLESFYNWVAIDLISRSDTPLFPPYKPNANGSEWPADKKFITLRETLRRSGFHSVAAAVRPLGEEEIIRCPVYESADGLTRVTIHFIPSSTGRLRAFLSAGTQTQSGLRLVTDNVFLPFGGFYPENFLVERRPMVRSLKRLLTLHARRLEKLAEAPAPWSGDAVSDLNEQQSRLEELNLQLGFFVPLSEREELGTISREGRTRLWMEIWMLNYLGRAFSYR
jgi:hypothetical protein